MGGGVLALEIGGWEVHDTTGNLLSDLPSVCCYNKKIKNKFLFVTFQ